MAGWWVALGLSANFGIAALAQSGIPTTNPVSPTAQHFREQQRAYRAARPKLQAEAKAIVTAEGSRDTAHDCPTANTTVAFEDCFGTVLKTAEGDLARLEQIVLALNNAPVDPSTPLPASPGVAGPELTEPQLAAEFQHMEDSWRAYRKIACAAAFHQFGGGTGGPNAELECSIRLTRDHIREVDTVYGMDLHL